MHNIRGGKTNSRKASAFLALRGMWHRGRFKPLPRSFAASSFFLPYPLLGLPLRSLEGDRGGIDNPAMHYIKGALRAGCLMPIPKNNCDDDSNGGWDDCPTPPCLKTVHYICMHVHAAGQAAPRRRTGQRPTRRNPKRQETGKNKNLEDKGGRGDRLSPVGILNHLWAQSTAHPKRGVPGLLELQRGCGLGIWTRMHMRFRVGISTLPQF